jgi:hypothetical protein
MSFFNKLMRISLIERILNSASFQRDVLNYYYDIIDFYRIATKNMTRL